MAGKFFRSSFPCIFCPDLPVSSFTFTPSSASLFTIPVFLYFLHFFGWRYFYNSSTERWTVREYLVYAFYQNPHRNVNKSKEFFLHHRKANHRQPTQRTNNIHYLVFAANICPNPLLMTASMNLMTGIRSLIENIERDVLKFHQKTIMDNSAATLTRYK